MVLKYSCKYYYNKQVYLSSHNVWNDYRSIDSNRPLPLSVDWWLWNVEINVFFFCSCIKSYNLISKCHLQHVVHVFLQLLQSSVIQMPMNVQLTRIYQHGEQYTDVWFLSAIWNNIQSTLKWYIQDRLFFLYIIKCYTHWMDFYVYNAPG